MSPQRSSLHLAPHIDLRLDEFIEALLGVYGQEIRLKLWFFAKCQHTIHA